MSVSEKRQELLRDLVGEKVPRLWCPPLTHYTSDGELDRARISAHWRFLASHVKGFLVPGSTGDAWEMTDVEIRTLVDLALDLAGEHEAWLLLGTLRRDASATCQRISEMLRTLQRRTGEEDPLRALKASRVCGFTVCPPGGSELTEEEMEAGLEKVLGLGLPTVLYQLPQVTHNEMSPSLVARLANRHAHLVILKDSSGRDRVALEDEGCSGIFLVRGAEGRYTRWLRESGGPYQGLLLGTANCFPGQLATIVSLLEAGRIDEATDLSDRLTRVEEQVSALVSDLPDGNAFTNANKAMDHFMAFGTSAWVEPPPRLHAGTCIPEDVILQVGEVLESANLVPATGYLSC